jgi:hypothetical protein
MVAFTNEILVRQRGLLRLFDEVPSDLLNRCIEEAHERLTEATSGISETEPPRAVVEAETDLVLSEVLRILAVSREIQQPPYRTRDLSLDDPGRSKRLLTLADREEERAWSRLEPYLKHTTPSRLELARPTTNVNP